MRRGFKKWCETTAERYRADLGVKPEDPLDPKILATRLGVTVWQPEEIPGLAESSLDRLINQDSASWSAVSIRIGNNYLAIINSAHAPTRKRSSLCHELAHVILDHKPGRIDLSAQGHLLLNSYDQEQEEEADWLSGTFLVPRTGLMRMYRSNHNLNKLANHFGVSLDMLNWRLRMTGVATQARRARKLSRR